MGEFECRANALEIKLKLSSPESTIVARTVTEKSVADAHKAMQSAFDALEEHGLKEGFEGRFQQLAERYTMYYAASQMALTSDADDHRL